ncbi:unnamed protein product [Acanthoscelides obtectus]|uniref:Uncharacterized protein n=1 Tax=Acanthoscelides obtectus TaxID=200917 RepID=A0A9P0PZQ4_ACAOB|nr:unnamed protein product [Acanthoscelides obtectus]CAK1635315.1 hypothetical protein AOBTE_LOCUS9197 [Acanthoscelides obtectus]
MDDINQLFQSHNVELTERELIELTENNYEAQEKGEDDELVPAPKELTLKTLNKCFTMAHYLTELLISEDPTVDRSLKTKREQQHWRHTRKLRRIYATKLNSQKLRLIFLKINIFVKKLTFNVLIHNMYKHTYVYYVLNKSLCNKMFLFRYTRFLFTRCFQRTLPRRKTRDACKIVS